MARKGLIYKLESPSNRVYIGQTVDLEDRIKQYRNYMNYKGRKQPKLFNSIKKYGWENFKIEILLDNVPMSMLDNVEIKYIHEYNSFKGLNGLNCTPGGGVLRGEDHPLFGKKLSEETGKKISNSMKGRKASTQAKENMSKARRGKKQPNISKVQLGKKRKLFTEEHRSNLSESIKAAWKRRKALRENKN